MSQIKVVLNPDVPPTGSDLGITNAARRSFGVRSDWCRTDLCGDEITWVLGESGKQLRYKDKRLLEFLARGMTADDFEVFVEKVRDLSYDELVSDYSSMLKELIESLWQWRNTPTHDTPFNHGFFSFEVKAPIFVARHLVKHEYLIMSEYSRRYITDDVEFYEPDMWRKAAPNKKQGSTNEPVDFTTVMSCSGLLPHEYLYDAAIEHYNELLRCGVSPEQARMVLPQSLMTSWTWSGTLGAFANMCKLRLGKDTQAETRYVAEKVYEELKKQFPVAAPLLVEGVL